MAQGAKAAATHTGALAGADAVYDAAFQRAGILRVSDLRELFDCAETLGRLKSPPGKRLAILTNGGGIGVLAVDRLVELGGIPADISPALRKKLDAVLPPTWSKSNPVDIVGDADPARYAAALEILLADPGNDAVLTMNVQTAIARADHIASAVIGVAGKYRAEHRMSPKPVLAVWVGADHSISALLSGAGIPNYQTGGDAVLGFMHLVRHREVVEALAQVPPAMPSEFAPDTDTARKIVGAALADGRSWLDPIEVKRLLDAYEIAAVPTFAAANEEEAVAHDRTTRSAAGRWGILFQQGALFSSLSVRQNIQFPLRENLELSDTLMDEIATAKLEMVGLKPEDGDKFPSELSGGMVKRVALARALALDPAIVFLDEPTSGLDPIAAGDFDALIKTLQKTLGLTVFMAYNLWMTVRVGEAESTSLRSPVALQPAE